MAFRAGQKVVCVDVRANPRGRVPVELIKGRVYTIAAVASQADCTGDFGIHLIGVGVVPELGSTGAFKSYRFRRVTDISIFTKMLTGKRVDA